MGKNDNQNKHISTSSAGKNSNKNKTKFQKSMENSSSTDKRLSKSETKQHINSSKSKSSESKKANNLPSKKPNSETKIDIQNNTSKLSNISNIREFKIENLNKISNKDEAKQKLRNKNSQRTKSDLKEVKNNLKTIQSHLEDIKNFYKPKVDKFNKFDNYKNDENLEFLKNLAVILEGKDFCTAVSWKLDSKIIEVSCNQFKESTTITHQTDIIHEVFYDLKKDFNLKNLKIDDCKSLLKILLYNLVFHNNDTIFYDTCQESNIYEYLFFFLKKIRPKRVVRQFLNVPYLLRMQKINEG